MNINSFQEKNSGLVQQQYGMGFNHIRSERERKRDIMNKVLDPNLPEGQVRVNLLWKNIQLENALFLNDEINVEVLASNGVLGEEVMQNANLVLKYDDQDMDLYEMREDIVNDNALYGLSATIIDGRDDDEKQPISDTISPLSLIIDPKNYTGSKLRFIGVERRVSIDFLQSASFDQAKIKMVELTATSSELTLNERSDANSNNLREAADNEGMVDIYDHFNIIDGKKYLSTWINDNADCIRVIELEGLTEAEKLRPNKVKFPIQLHRRKPKKGNVFGVSVADEVLVYQDTISQLTNLQLINARMNALGPDIFVDDKLGVDTSILSQGKPGGRVMPISNKTGMPTQNGIYSFNTPAPSQYTDQMIQVLEGRAEGTTGVGGQNFGTSQSGTQTKAEIQTLQQNANQILIWISNNYLRGQKEYWMAHYRSYALNMGKGKKVISLFQKGNALSLDLDRNQFIQDGKVNIVITSKSQQSLINDQEFNKLSVIANIYLPNITSEYSKNEFLRKLGDKSNIKDFDSSKYIRESIDEIDAKDNLELLNNNKEVPAPEMDNNPDVYLDIYKQAMDTPAKAKALEEWNAFAEWKKKQEMNPQNVAGEGDAMSGNIAMNNLNQTENQTPSTADINI